MFDAFTARLGLGQGRVQPGGAQPSSGAHVFVLGDDEPGRRWRLAPGDHAEVVQQVDLTGVDLIRAALRVRVADDVPAGLAWEVSFVVDGQKLARTTCGPGRTRTLNDLAANVSKRTGPHAVGVRLELIAEP